MVLKYVLLHYTEQLVLHFKVVADMHADESVQSASSSHYHYNSSLPSPYIFLVVITITLVVITIICVKLFILYCLLHVFCTSVNL